MSLYSQRLFKTILLFLLSVMLLGVARVEYLAWNWASFSHQGVGDLALAFLVGARFDLAASAWLIAPILLFSLMPWPAALEPAWRRIAFAVFVVLQVPFLILNLADTEFVNFVGRRMTADVLFIVGEAQGKVGGLLQTFAVLFAINTVVVAAQVFFAWKIVFAPSRAARPEWAPSGRLARGTLAVLLFLLTVLASRGGWQNKPISFVNANVFAAPLLNNLVLNTSFNILKNLEQENLPRVKFFDDRAEMLKHLNGAGAAPSLLEGRRPSRPQNVVVFILESFGSEYWGAAGGAGWTPFLDSLAAKSLFFKNGFANGRRSIEGVAAVMTGIPALMNEPFITSPFTANRFVGLGTSLTERGYQTAFFHGGHNGTMHFDSFMKSAGVDRYYGASEYPNPKDDDGTWGIYDGPFFQWMLAQMNGFKTPFLAVNFSISSHNPYALPPEARDRYPEGPLPIAKTIRYTDEALKDFFAAAEKEPWFKDTLFVITADHTFKAPSPEWDNEISRYRVPILFYHPNFTWPAGLDRDQIVQQIDILPSVLDVLGLPTDEGLALERSVFQPGERTATLFLDGNYMIVAKDFYLQQPRGAPGQMYSMTDPAAAHPLTEPMTRKVDLELRLKAAIQYFSEGMWDNRLYR